MIAPWLALLLQALSVMWMSFSAMLTLYSMTERLRDKPRKGAELAAEVAGNFVGFLILSAPSIFVIVRTW